MNIKPLYFNMIKKWIITIALLAHTSLSYAIPASHAIVDLLSGQNHDHCNTLASKDQTHSELHTLHSQDNFDEVCYQHCHSLCSVVFSFTPTSLAPTFDKITAYIPYNIRFSSLVFDIALPPPKA